MQITSFKDMYVAELQELRSLEVQLDETLLRLTALATHRSLKDLLADHRARTLGHKERLDGLLLVHNADPRQHTDQAMQALLAETEKMMTIVKGAALRDAALIASTQKPAHYQIAAYGSAAALAGQLDLRDDQALLHESLEDEKEIDFMLTRLAKLEVNRDAVAA